MRRNALWSTVTGLLLFVGIAAVGKADFQYSIVNPTGGPTGGTFVLPRSASTPVQIFLNSTSAAQTIGSLQFRISIGDGPGANPEPLMVGITPAGQFGAGSGYTAGAGQPQFDPGPLSGYQMIYDLTNTATPIGFAGNQLVATVFLNTLAFPTSGPFAFSLTNTSGSTAVTATNGTAYANTGLSGGTFTLAAVPEPTSMALLGMVGIGVFAARRFRKKSKA